MTPALCANENDTGDLSLSDVRVGCNGNGEYFSDSGGSVTITGIPEPGYGNILENQSLIGTYEDPEPSELYGDTVPDGMATDDALYTSAQPSTVRNITVESEHPYANNYTYTWEISEPGASQMRLHFDKLRLAGGDTLSIYDELGRELVDYGYASLNYDATDFWTQWQTTDTLRVKLSTGNSGTSYGFLIDQTERRDEKVPPTEHFAESYHPYANNYVYTWEISEPGANQMRLHFDKLNLGGGDSLSIYDELGRELVDYGYASLNYDATDFWTEWQTIDTLRVKLSTGNSGTSYGFLIDRAERRDEKFPYTEHFAESYHPYANNYVHIWEISMPGANQTRLHFDKLSLAKSDTLRIYDVQGRQLVCYEGSCDNTDFWTEWQTTDIFQVKLSTGNSGTSYGFLIDLIETEEGVFTPSQIPAPADLALSAGWNFISVPRPLAAGNDTALIFTPVATDGHSVFRYNTAAGKWVALVATDQIAPLEGFWLYSAEPTTVPLNFSNDPLTPPSERALISGWNAIGITGTTPAAARDALLSVSGNWTTLIGFDAKKQAFETGIISGGSNDYADSRLVYQGKGYWLYMTGPGTLCAVGA